MRRQHSLLRNKAIKNIMPKKIFYTILIVFIITTIGGLVWYFISKPKEIAPPVSNVDFTAPGQIKNNTNIRVLSESPVISARLDDYGILWYYDYSGQLWQFSGDGVIDYNDSGDPVAIGQPINDLSEIIWPKVSSPDGKKVVYQKNNSLFTSDSNGKNQKTLISDLKLKDIILKWPNANKIALTSKPSGLVAGGLWFLDIRNLGIIKIIGDFFGLETLFSQSGDSFIYSYADQNGKNLTLAVYGKNGNQKIINNISTLVDKCVWAEDLINIYCAVPKSWPDFAVLPDDYYKNAFSTTDDIWKINTETSEKILVVENIGNISNLAVSKDESRIFFILKENQFLYKLNLK